MLASHLIAAIFGAIASAFYFGGLWLTVHRLANTSNPLGLYMLSFAVRGGALSCGVLLLLRMGWQHVVAAFVGFLIVRYLMTAALGLRESKSLSSVSQP